MVVEKFSQDFINTGIFKLYTAVGFFATVIFFVLNTELFSPLQMLFGAVLTTVFLKACSNLVLSFVVRNFSLDKRRLEFDDKYNEEKISLMLNQLSTEEINKQNEIKINEEENKKEE